MIAILQLAESPWVLKLRHLSLLSVAALLTLVPYIPISEQPWFPLYLRVSHTALVFVPILKLRDNSESPLEEDMAERRVYGLYRTFVGTELLYFNDPDFPGYSALLVAAFFRTKQIRGWLGFKLAHARLSRGLDNNVSSYDTLEY